MSRIRIKAVESNYTPLQVAQYLSHIRFPSFLSESSPLVSTGLESEHQAGSSVNGGILSCTLDNLETLVQRHLVTFPFENTAMHYTEKHQMDISPKGLFQRLVLVKRGLGSYCFGQNELLLGMLRGLGYCAYAGPARVNQTPPNSESDAVEFTPQSHMILFVQLPASDADADASPVRDMNTYLVDVGFGGLGLVRPILLRAGSVVRGAAPPEEHRLIRARHPHSSLLPVLPPISEITEELDSEDPSLDWRLQVHCGTYVSDWRTVYQFTLLESYQEDRYAMNFAVSQRDGHAPFFTHVMAISHFFLREGSDTGEMGRMVLFGGWIGGWAMGVNGLQR